MKLPSITTLIKKHHRSGADSFGGGLLGAVIGGAVGGGMGIVTGGLIGYLAATGYYHYLTKESE